MYNLHKSGRCKFWKTPDGNCRKAFPAPVPFRGSAAGILSFRGGLPIAGRSREGAILNQ